LFKRFFSSAVLAEKSLVTLIKDGRRPPRQSRLDAVLSAVKSEADFAIGARSVRRAAAAKVIRSSSSNSSPSIDVNHQRTSSLLSRAGTRAGQAKRVLEIFNARNEWSKMTMTSGAASYLFDHAATLSTTVPPASASSTPPSSAKQTDAKSKDATKTTTSSSSPVIPILPLSPAAAFAEEVHALARAHGVKPSRSYTYSGVSAGLVIGGKTGLRLAVRIAMEGSKAPFHDGASLRLLGALWTGGIVEKASDVPKGDGQVSSRLSLLRLAELEFLDRLVTSLAAEDGVKSAATDNTGKKEEGGVSSTVEKVRPGTVIARLMKDEIKQCLEKAVFKAKSKSMGTSESSSTSTNATKEEKV